MVSEFDEKITWIDLSKPNYMKTCKIAQSNYVIVIWIVTSWIVSSDFVILWTKLFASLFNSQENKELNVCDSPKHTCIPLQHANYQFAKLDNSYFPYALLPYLTFAWCELNQMIVRSAISFDYNFHRPHLISFFVTFCLSKHRTRTDRASCSCLNCSLTQCLSDFGGAPENTKL